MSTEEVRTGFLSYFVSRNHQQIPGSSIIPVNDPTLLFINSGMAPLKPFFTGEQTPPSPRLTDVQHCIRTVDLDDVGDSHHGTSFRMMGSWSFGSYFKEAAIPLALELIVNGFGFPLDRLYATVYNGNLPGIPADEESAKIWSQYLPASRIMPRPAEDNFWGPPGGITGPCGPCTEVFFDRGPEYGQGYSGSDPLIPGRFIEIWNAGVFMQYFRNPDGSLATLPMACVDTGAGLERFAMLLQGADSIHEIDQYLPAYNAIFEVLKNTPLSRLVLDHLKTSLMIMAEGVRPGSQRQGHVLRTLLRRVLTVLKMQDLIASSVVTFADMVGSTLDQRQAVTLHWDSIRSILEQEAGSFERVLRSARKPLRRLESSPAGSVVDPQLLFTLKATNGVPLEYLQGICQRHSLIWPGQELEVLLTQHSETSRARRS